MRERKARRDYERAVRDSGDRFLIEKSSEGGKDHDHSGRLWGRSVVDEHFRQHHSEIVGSGESIQDLHRRHDALHAELIDRSTSESSGWDETIDPVGDQSQPVEPTGTVRREVPPPRSRLIVATLGLVLISLLVAGGSGWVAWEARGELDSARSDLGDLEDALAVQEASLLILQGQLRNMGLEGLELRVSELEDIAATHDFALNTLVGQGTAVPPHTHAAGDVEIPIGCGGAPAVWGLVGLWC